MLHELAAYCALSTVYCFMNVVVVKSVGHGSCIMGHGSIFVWVSGSSVNAYDPLPALEQNHSSFPYQTSWRYSNGCPLTEASNAGWVGRNRNSEPISGFVAYCQRCSRLGVINTAPPDRGKL